ncbi:MAG: response regulator, partial [Polyangiaceae bacterium]|nr:response regulator [Polyangiaceae bacterium]
DQPRVMVVDADTDLREGGAQLLERRHVTVATASNGEEALSLLRAGVRPKAILLDLWMPVMDGETLCYLLHEDRELSSIPVLILSADAARALRLTHTCAAGFLPKPVNLTALMQTLERVAH